MVVDAWRKRKFWRYQRRGQTHTAFLLRYPAREVDPRRRGQLDFPQGLSSMDIAHTTGIETSRLRWHRPTKTETSRYNGTLTTP